MCDGNLSAKEERQLVDSSHYWCERAQRAEEWSKHWRTLYFEAMAKLADLEPLVFDGSPEAT